MKKAVKTVSFIVIATMLAKVMGLVRDMFFASGYGTGIESMAYMNATRIPLLFFDLTLGVAILSTFIPVFNRYLEKGDKKSAIAFSNNFINIVVLFSTVFCIVGIIFSKQFAQFIGPGMSLETQELTSSLLIILLPTTIFTALAYCFVGILQSFDEFNIPAIISLVSNLAVIVYLIFFNQQFGIYGVAVAMLIGWSLQVIIQIPSLIKKGYKYKFTLNFKDKGIIDVFKLALPILISSWLQPICFMINTMFASYLNEGQAVSALEYANRFYIIIVGVFAFGITNYIFPSLSKMSGGGDSKGFSDMMKQSIKVMILIIAPIMIGMIILAKPIISIIYGRGEFSETSILLTSTALKFYSIGMISYGLNEIINKCFYAMKDGKTPMYSSIFGIISTITFAYVFTNIFNLEIAGLALSAALSAIIVSIILLIKINIKVENFINFKLIKYVLKILLSTVVMALVVIYVSNITAGYGVFIQLILSVMCGVVIYFPMLFILKVKEIREVIK